MSGCGSESEGEGDGEGEGEGGGKSRPSWQTIAKRMNRTDG